MSGLTEEQRAAVRYLLPGERVVVFARRHWTVVWEPVVSALAGFLLVFAVSLKAGDVSPNRGIDLLWWCWFALLGRALFKVLEWRRDHFVATDRRLLLIYGLIVRKVAMMPLKKVTDLSYHRSVPGRLFGYGTFVLESAGQDQALRVLHHVDRPDDTYRAIMSVIFRRPGDEGYGETEVVTVLPEDTTGRNSLARLQGLLPSPSRRRWWGRRAAGGDAPSTAGFAQVDPVRPGERPLLRDDRGEPLAGGRSVYSSNADAGATGAWDDPDDD